MKALESILTYFPLIYLVACSVVVALFNHVYFPMWRPVTTLTLILVNSAVLLKFDNKVLVKTRFVRNLWNSAIHTVFGFTMNIVRDDMFDLDFEISNGIRVHMLSGIYIAGILFANYVLMSEKALVSIHIVFMYFPLRRNWVLSLVFFCVSNVTYVVLLYSNIPAFKLVEPEIIRRPILNTYQYLCVHHYFLSISIVHILFEWLFKTYIDDMRSQYELVVSGEDILNEIENVEVRKHNEDDDSEVDRFLQTQ